MNSLLMLSERKKIISNHSLKYSRNISSHVEAMFQTNSITHVPHFYKTPAKDKGGQTVEEFP